VGKTRLAVEYAWRNCHDYTGLFFVGADSPEALQRNLAALCAAAVLNLPEREAADETVQAGAVLAWLRQHRGWLLILDNVDTEAAAQATERLLPQLPGGHVLITSRVAHWSSGVQALPLDVLEPAAAVDFLLARTEARRRKQADDPAQARALAGELGGLALALEQAGAYIAQRRLSLAEYLLQWRGQQDKVLAWFDARLMQYPRSVAVTWQTSFDQLGAPARRLLGWLAWLAAAPVPESLLDVPVPGVEPAEDLHAALAELEAYSLVSRADAAPSFTVHRLVQVVTRRGADVGVLTEALEWVNAAFVGEPQDVRSWHLLDPLMPHAQSVAGHADLVNIGHPTARLMNQCGLMLHRKAHYAEAEPLLRRALATREKDFDPEDPQVAIFLNNLAMLLMDTSRLAEAEPLIRRAVAIDEKCFGVDHFSVAGDYNNLANLLQDTNRLPEAEPLKRRVLAIVERSLGSEHPKFATALNNLATLLQDTNRLAEAEPLMRQALAIDEKCFGTQHPSVALRLNNLAMLLRDTNRLAEAEPLMSRALITFVASLGPDHPRSRTAIDNHAGLLVDMGLDEQEVLARQQSLLRGLPDLPMS
jgi:tetratricopeptide (TPR) repeat protein